MPGDLFQRFLTASDEAEADRALNALLEEQALPLARAIAGRKLRAQRSDVDDVVADAMLALVERLHAARADPEGRRIENFQNYAATVIYSACAHHVRRRYPERARLKSRLRYVLETDRRLALWVIDDEAVCGVAAHRGRGADSSVERGLADAASRIDLRWTTAERGRFSDALAELLAAAGGAVPLESLVAVIAADADVIEPRQAGDVADVAAPQHPPEQRLDDRRGLAAIWREVGELPIRQRLALLLNLRDARGAGLLWLLPIAGIASVRQIARLLEIPDDEFAALWQRLPLDDATIGQRLGCARQQVINLRMAARKRLSGRMRGAAATNRPAGGTRANLTRVSASLKGNA